MMKYTCYILCLTLTCVAGACTENTMLTPPPYEVSDEKNLEEVSLNLERLPVRVIGEAWEAEAETRVASAAVKENAINNIWVFQYDSSNKQLTAPRYYTVSSLTNLKIMLRPATNCKVYILANTNNSAWANARDVSTVDKLNNQTQTFNNESAVYGGSHNNMMMWGNAANVTVNAGANNNLGTIEMKRMVAKISFKYTLASTITGGLNVTKIAIENVPDIIGMKEPSAAPHPATLTACTYNDINSPVAGTTYTWYVPENLRGITANTNEKTKNETAPANALTIRLYVDSQLDGSNYVYTIYPGENKTNDFNIKRNYFYNVSLQLNSASTDSRVMAAPANCFVLTPKSSIIFDPYDRGEKGGGFVYSDYVNKNDNNKKITSVKILWQTGNGTDFAIGNNSTGKLVYLDTNDKIHVTAGNINGNAVIAGYNNKNEVVWSWHIWVNSNMPAQVSKAVPYTTYAWDSSGIKSSDPNNRVSGKPVMSCNLGALGTTVGAASYGLLYQWGRKDPFPQGKEDYHFDAYPYSSDYIVSVYDNASKQIKMSTTVGTGELFQTVMVNATNGNINYTLKHPTHFIKAANIYSTVPADHVNEGDWFWGHNDRLWGGKPVSEASKVYETSSPHSLLLADNGAIEKSIFDPCPSGWMLAPGDMWLGFTKTGFNVADTSYQTINCSETTTAENNANHGYHIYMQGWKKGVTVYFPSQGLRIPNGDPWRNGVCGNYHTSTPGRDGTVYILHLHTTASISIFEVSYPYTRRSVAGPIRCVRETK